MIGNKNIEAKNKKNRSFSSARVPFINLLPKEARDNFANLGRALHDSLKNLSKKYSAKAYEAQVIVDFKSDPSFAYISNQPTLLGFAETEKEGNRKLCAYYIININYDAVRGNFDYITTGILDKKAFFEYIKRDLRPELEYKDTLTGNLLSGTIVHELTHMSNMHITASVIPEFDKIIKTSKYMPNESVLDDDSTFLERDFAVVSSIIKKRPDKFSLFKSYSSSDFLVKSIAEMEASSSELIYILALGTTALKAFDIFFNELISGISRIEAGKKDIIISKFLSLLSEYRKNDNADTLEVKNKKLVEVLYVLASNILGRKKEELRQTYKNILESIIPKGKFGWLDLMSLTYSESFHNGVNYTTIINDVVFYTAYIISKFNFDESKEYSSNFENIKIDVIKSYLEDFALDLDITYKYFVEYFTIYKSNVAVISQFLRIIDNLLYLVKNNDNELLYYFSKIKESKFNDTRFFKELFELVDNKFEQVKSSENLDKEKERKIYSNCIIEGVKEIIAYSFAELGSGYDSYILQSLESKSKGHFLSRMLTIQEFSNIMKWINLGFYDIFDRKSFIDTLKNNEVFGSEDYKVLGNMDSALLFLLKSYEIFVEEVNDLISEINKMNSYSEVRHTNRIIDDIISLVTSMGDINSNNIEYKKKMLQHYQKALKDGRSKSTGLDKMLSYTDVPNFSDNYILISCIYHTYMFCKNNMSGFTFKVNI